MAKAYAYFDESGTDVQSPTLAVAGYIFLEENVAPFTDEWKAMLEEYRVPFWHTVEAAHLADNFKAFTHQQTAAMQSAAIEIIKKYAAKGIALAIDKAAFPMVGFAAPAKWTTPYTFLCGQVLYGARDWANAVGFQGEIEYVFEAGVNGQMKAVEETTAALIDEVSIPIFRYGGHSHATKAEALPLQAADLLSWHWFTHRRRVVEGKGKRKDLQALMALRVDFHHYDEEAIGIWRAVWQATVRQMNKRSEVHSSLRALYGSLGRLD
jgi:hypothetical protein